MERYLEEFADNASAPIPDDGGISEDVPKTITMIPVQSSNLEEVGYDRTRQYLHINFHGGRRHVYHGVPESIFRGLLAAESAGRYFRSHIRGVYTSANVSSGAPV